VAAALGVANAKALELTKDNFDSSIGSGKNAFVKFQAPW
jgi:hypothetical protein